MTTPRSVAIFIYAADGGGFDVNAVNNVGRSHAGEMIGHAFAKTKSAAMREARAMARSFLASGTLGISLWDADDNETKYTQKHPPPSGKATSTRSNPPVRLKKTEFADTWVTEDGAYRVTRRMHQRTVWLKTKLRPRPVYEAIRYPGTSRAILVVEAGSFDNIKRKLGAYIAENA